MEILFLVLKLIGILLAVIVFLIVTVIVVPVHYRIGMRVQESVEGAAEFHWLCHLVNLQIQYEKDLTFQLRIFGIPIALGRQKKVKQEPQKAIEDPEILEVAQDQLQQSENREHSEKRGQAESFQERQEPSEGRGHFEGSKEQLECSKNEKTAKISLEQPEFPEDQVKRKVSQSAEDFGSSARRTAGREKQQTERKDNRNYKKQRKNRGFQNIPKKIHNFFSRVHQWVIEVKKKPALMKEKFQNIKTIVLEETNKCAFIVVIKEFKRLARHYSPRNVSGELLFSMGEPSQTGKILGVLSLFPFWTRYEVHLFPDFYAESFYVKGELQMKGYIRSWHILLSLFRLIKDKNIRTVIARFKA